MMRLGTAVLALTGVYALTLGSFAMWDLLAGAALSAALLLTCRKRVLVADREQRPARLRRLWALSPFVAVAAKNIVAGAWQVLRVILLGRSAYPALVTVPFGERTLHGVMISALIFSMTPGTLLVDVDEHRKEMLVHVLVAPDPEAFLQAQQRLYSRFQKKVFP